MISNNLFSNFTDFNEINKNIINNYKKTLLIEEIKLKDTLKYLVI